MEKYIKQSKRFSVYIQDNSQGKQKERERYLALIFRVTCADNECSFFIRTRKLPSFPVTIKCTENIQQLKSILFNKNVVYVAFMYSLNVYFGNWFLIFSIFCCLLQVLWTFSIYLESVAILPQLFMVSKTGEAESITSHYLFALGSYRGLYILNWVYRYITEEHYDLIAIVAGVVQTVLYCDFFYLYITKGKISL